MSDSAEKSQRELNVFQEFAERSGLPIVAGSIEKRNPREPDILCQIEGEGYVAFELKELCAEDIAEGISELLRTESEGAKYVRSIDPTSNIIQKAKNNKYQCDYPIELVFYTAGRTVSPPDIIIPQVRNCFGDGTKLFRRVWFMGAPEETCECVYGVSEVIE